MAADLIRRPEQTGVGNIDLTYRQLIKISGEKKYQAKLELGKGNIDLTYRQLIKISDLTKMKFKSNIDLTFYQLSCKSQI